MTQQVFHSPRHQAIIVQVKNTMASAVSVLAYGLQNCAATIAASADLGGVFLGAFR
jgi:hypothetical protein